MAGKKDFLSREEKLIEEKQRDIQEEEKEIKKLVQSEIIENKHIYEKLLELEKAIKGKDDVKFKHIEEWKHYVWDSCEDKTTIEKGNVIEHGCKRLNSACHFINCPKNNK